MTDARALLAELVRIPSPSGDEDRAAAFCADWLAARGLEVERVGKSVLARAVRGRGPRLFLNSHVDTVPAGQAWTVDPYAGEWDGDRLCALGANDAKASVVAMMLAAASWADSGAGAGELWLGLTEREETTNAGMALLLERLPPPDAAVTGEPTGLEVVRAQAGLGVLEARWRGTSCHAAHVARVPHASALFAAVHELATLPDHLVLAGEHPLLGASTLVATVLTAGDRHNRIPDAALAVFDARLAPPHTATECRELLAEALPSADVTIRSERLAPVETAADHPLVQVALAAAGRAAPIGSATMSDMALLSGWPAIKCGPGQTARSHTPDEFVLADELEAGVAFYRRVVPDALAALSSAPVREGDR